jgi:FkbM family methyltransferase
MLKALVTTALAKSGYRLSRVSSQPPHNSMRSSLAVLQKLGLAPATILDVGASDGHWSELALTYFPSAKLVLFEPQPVHAESLKQFQARHRGQTSIVSKAVGREPGTSYFDASDPFGGALSDTSGDRVISVPMTSLDDTIAELAPPQPYLVKLDTHGYERSILDGATATLRSACALVIEAYNYKISGECMLFWELCAYLQERGFRPVAMADPLYRPHDATLWQMDLFFVRATWPGFAHVSYE